MRANGPSVCGLQDGPPLGYLNTMANSGLKQRRGEARNKTNKGEALLTIEEPNGGPRRKQEKHGESDGGALARRRAWVPKETRRKEKGFPQEGKKALPKNIEKKSTESTHARGLRTLSQVKAWGGHDPKKEHRGETNTGGERMDEREREEKTETQYSGTNGAAEGSLDY